MTIKKIVYRAQAEHGLMLRAEVVLIDPDEHGIRKAYAALKIYIEESVNGNLPVLRRGRYQQGHRAFEVLREEWGTYEWVPVPECADDAPVIGLSGVYYGEDGGVRMSRAYADVKAKKPKYRGWAFTVIAERLSETWLEQLKAVGYATAYTVHEAPYEHVHVYVMTPGAHTVEYMVKKYQAFGEVRMYGVNGSPEMYMDYMISDGSVLCAGLLNGMKPSSDLKRRFDAAGDAL